MSAIDLLDRCHEVMGIPPIERAAEEAHRESARFSGLVTLESASVAEAAAAAVAAGTGTVPEGTAERFDKHDAETNRNVMQARRHQALSDQLNEAARMLRGSAVDKGLAVLRDELAAVLNEARPVAQRLGSVTNSDAAIAADKVTEWRTLTELAGRLRDVRQAQRQLVWDARTDGGPVREVDACGHVRAPDQYADVRSWRAQQQGPRRQANTVFVGQPEERVALPWLVDDPVAVLLFELRADVKTWLPSMRELRAEQAAVDARTRPAPDDADQGNQGAQVTAGRDAPLWIRPASSWSRARAAGKQGG